MLNQDNELISSRITPCPISKDPNVFLFTIQLDGPSPTPELYTILGPEEKARAQRFIAETPRQHFLWCRLALKYLLIQITENNFCGIDPTLSPRGRPSFPLVDVDFNISHSGSLGLIGILLGKGSIGVDIEGNRQADYDTIAHYCFSVREHAEDKRSALPPQTCFLRRWTCKEALLKAVGTGLADDLTQIEFSFQQNEHHPVLLNHPFHNNFFCRTAPLPSQPQFHTAWVVMDTL